MPLTPPPLDPRRYADIVQEARTRIPRYTKEWTDFNDSDPGMTLIQLFAWMTDMLLYQLNQVPELNYRKFLQLIGIELLPARSANAYLTFQLNRPDTPTTPVPQGTRVAGPGTPPTIFETDEALFAIGPPLLAVQVFDGFAYDDNSKANSAPWAQIYPFGHHAHEKSALLLGFDSPAAFPTDVVDLMVFVRQELTSPTGVQCITDLSRVPPPAVVAWQYWDKSASSWLGLRVESDQTRAFTRSGHVRVQLPAAASFEKDSLGAVNPPYYWFRAYLRSSQYERAPQLEQVVTNTISATQALTVADEVLGGSAGAPRQTFKLANRPVVVLDQPYSAPGPDNQSVSVTSLQVEVDEGEGFKAWQEVRDFFRSSPDDAHFTVNHTSGDITFGDGRRGRIPLPNAANPSANIVARRYRTGGGSSGNLAPGTITSIKTAIAGVQSVTNLRAAMGGSDEEPIDDAKLRAADELKTNQRAVTAEDYEDLAKSAPGAAVQRAKALPMFDPSYPDVDVPGAVTVIAVPAGDQPNPMPNETTLTAVCAYLDNHRLLTAELHVVPPEYHLVQVTVDAVAEPQADVAEVTKLIRRVLLTYLNPLTGGDDGNGWEFGGTIYYSKLYRRILDLPGVDRIDNNALVIQVDGNSWPACQDVPISRHSLVYTLDDRNRVNVAYGTVPIQ